jgi:hypothetical protein
VPGGGPGWPAPDQQRQRPRGPADCSPIRAPSTCARSTCSPTWTAGASACSTPQPSMSPSMRSSPPARTPAALPRLAHGRADAGRLPAPARPLPSGAGRRSNLTSSRYGQAGRLPVARSFERHPRAGNRSERTITPYLIGLRQADTSQVPPGRARYRLPRPTLSRVRRTVRPCCARGPPYGSATGGEGAAPRRRGGGRSWRDREGEDRGAHPLVQVEPDREAHASLAGGRSARGWRLPSRADQHRSTKAMTSGNAGHRRARGA